MADIAAAAGKDHAVAVRQIQHTDCEIKIPVREVSSYRETQGGEDDARM